MSNTVNLNGDIESELWDQLKKKNPDLEEQELLTKIITEYVLLTSDEGEEGSMLIELKDQKKLSESLRKKCKNFALRVKELEDIQADQEGTIQKLKKEIKKISKDFPDFGEEQKVKEKIVYKEDTKTIKELKEKRDSLQKTIWEKNAELENCEKAITSLKENLEGFETEKSKTFAILARLILNKETSNYEFSFENISRGEFNKLMRSKLEFCKYKKIFTPASVIQLWESENEESRVIDLNEAVNELRNKSDTKLNEISLPYSQYESLKSFEKKYMGIKEESEKLKEDLLDFEQSNKDLTTEKDKLEIEIKNIKENPVIKEKIVYKENTKELNELKGECERLRLKLFNYETGRMSVPTHGINVGNAYKVKILGVGKDGDGFTRVNNFIIFVPNTTKDQEVNIKVTRVLKKYAFGKVMEGATDEVVLDATTGNTGDTAGTQMVQPTETQQIEEGNANSDLEAEAEALAKSKDE
jgi:predicted RNA-binding protein with TRAM domain